MTDVLASKVASPKAVLSGITADHTEGMSYLESLPRRLITLYLPLSLIMIVLLFPFYWMALTAIKPDEQLLVRLNGGQRHPVEREQQDDDDDPERQIKRDQAPRQRLQIAHADGVVVGSRRSCRSRQHRLEVEPLCGQISHCFHLAATCVAAVRTRTP